MRQMPLNTPNPHLETCAPPYTVDGPLGQLQPLHRRLSYGHCSPLSFCICSMRVAHAPKAIVHIPLPCLHQQQQQQQPLLPLPPVPLPLAPVPFRNKQPFLPAAATTRTSVMSGSAAPAPAASSPPPPPPFPSAFHSTQPLLPTPPSVPLTHTYLCHVCISSTSPCSLLLLSLCPSPHCLLLVEGHELLQAHGWGELIILVIIEVNGLNNHKVMPVNLHSKEGGAGGWWWWGGESATACAVDR